ncbi:MAG: beta-aspartyl-peptidase [Gammaproteobacteria bacterium]|nr:beta-aspartyl-peptidase [Gammaproteobacteria bacterium]MBU2058058.1 beta-aspartyl-peptidase [Gammaproteobacteria bacterium]MBU2175965.1 beta-aspartyl-peptidase [Gammaproteobacteria bacterium]MBU2247152.1 beta-aspartyl-peptidase [Gammaproteobacteria bacterium]MBU2343304.1 beta-aspartyl-peptidase [Gammaproteobacteria bacterium]
MSTVKLFKNAHLISPADLGTMDLLVAGSQIAALQPGFDTGSSNLPIEVIDASHCYLVPGFVDSLVHFIGGGGEGGFASRTPEMQLTDATLGGVTTAIGVLGTDATTRTLTNLLAKAHALETEGISTYCHTGSYEIPCRTLMGTITDDLILIDKFIGVGEIAISDFRSSQPTIDEIRKVAAAAKVGGILSGKAGLVSVHVGSGDSLLQPLWQAVEGTEIKLSQFYPTHINRNEAVFQAGLEFAKAGAVIDFTTSTTSYDLQHGEVAAAAALARALEAGIPAMNLTLSSDGNASLPVYNDHGELVGLEVGQVQTLYQVARQAVLEYKVPLPDAITAITAAPAAVLGLKQKGRIAAGMDADLVLLHKSDLTIRDVFAKGRQLVKDGKAIVKGTFEK